MKKRETLKSQVYEYLKESIIYGDIKPGDRLIEEKISSELDVSRSPIREAVGMLEKDGLLSVNKSGGVTVVKPTIEEYRSLFECRVEIEPLAAYYAAQRRTPKMLEEIESSFIQANRTSGEMTLRKINNANHRFHESIVEATGNPFLISMIIQLRGVSSFYRKAILEADPLRTENAVLDHQKIYQAIVIQDADAAKHLMREHVKSDYQVFMELFEKK